MHLAVGIIILIGITYWVYLCSRPRTWVVNTYRVYDQEGTYIYTATYKDEETRQEDLARGYTMEKYYE